MRKWTIVAVIAVVSVPGCATNKRFAVRSVADDPSARYFDSSASIPDRVADLVRRMTLDEKISQLMSNSPAIDRLGVSACNWWNECLHGVARNGRATVFPQAIGLAATFDESLMREIGEAIGIEARAKYEIAKTRQPGAQYAGLTFWSPNINIFRDPRWGRGQETYGEDPYLTGRMGVAFVQGLQGDRSPYLQVAGCAKHFAAHSGPERGRDAFDSVVSAKDLRETYLPAFRMLVKAKVAGVMCAYNRVGGRPCCGDTGLLYDTLRNEWGFEGYVVSDCGALYDIHTHHGVTTSPVESAAMALRNGVDLNCGNVYASLPDAVEQGLVSEPDIDRALSRLLTIRMRLGEFDSAASSPFAGDDADVIACQAHRDLARRAASESVVMLKNANRTLPLRKDVRSIYVTGANAAAVDVLLGNYAGISDQFVTILEGIVSATDSACQVRYEQGCLLNTPNANDSNLVAYQASGADAVLAVLGTSPLMEGETGDSIASVDGGDRSDLGLPANQLDLLRRLRAATNRPIVLVLTGGSPIIAPEIEELADAILFVWYPGEVGGHGVADILFGDAAPSGRLPVTFPASLADLPPYDDYAMRGRTYRFSTVEPLYPFGFGLTYSELAYSDFEIDSGTIAVGESPTVRFQVKNLGVRDVDEVVQIYISSVNIVPNSPQWSLCSFRRIRVEANESIQLTRTIPAEAMATVDESGKRAIRPGRYRLSIGGASPGRRSTRLGAPNPIAGEFVVVVRRD